MPTHGSSLKSSHAIANASLLHRAIWFSSGAHVSAAGGGVRQRDGDALLPAVIGGVDVRVPSYGDLLHRVPVALIGHCDGAPPPPWETELDLMACLRHVLCA